MKRAKILVQNREAGILEEISKGGEYRFRYHDTYVGPPVSLTLPTVQKEYIFQGFPPFFEGLLPEGVQLEGLLRQKKIDADDYFAQLVAVGNDLVGTVTVKEAANE